MRTFLSILSLIILINSCIRDIPEEDLSSVSISIDRFEEDLFSTDIYSLQDSVPFLKEKYPVFLPIFGSRVAEIGTPNHPLFSERLGAFVTDFTLYRVSLRVREVYPDLVVYEAALSDAFSRYHYYFPERTIPRVITCISGFNQSIITSDSLLVVSLEKYLGPEDEFYRLLHPPVPEYMRKLMHSERLVADAISGWLLTEFSYENEKDNLLGQMIYSGRAKYCTEQLLPHLKDTLIWGFSPKQMAFVKSNEKAMWEYFVEHKKLFVSDAFTIAQFINDAPFTKDFTTESPGRAAVWIGYQIVKDYLKNNSEITLEQLMLETDYQKILNRSKYNP